MADEVVEIETRSFDLGVLSERVAAATKAVEEDRAASEASREAMERRIAAANRKQRSWRVAGFIGAVVGPVAVTVAIFAVVLVVKANAERADRSQTSCVQSATAALRDNAQDATTVERLGSLAASADNPETAAFLEEWIADIEADESPVRDCSPAGIRAYFDSGGTEGYLP